MKDFIMYALCASQNYLLIVNNRTVIPYRLCVLQLASDETETSPA